MWKNPTPDAPLSPTPTPTPTPSAELVTVLTAMIEANGRVMEKIIQDGFAVVAATMERAAFGGPVVENVDNPAQTPNPDGPPWEGWGPRTAEASDADIIDPEWVDMTASGLDSTITAPDLAGERY